MTRLRFFLAFCLLVAASPRGNADTIFVGTLNGAQEVPPNFITPATGTFTGDLTVNGSMAVLTFTINYSDLIGGLVVGANFHNAPPGVNGPDVRDYDPGLFSSPDGTFSGSWTSSDAQPLTLALVAQLLAGNIYFEIETQEFPAGEIRGQLTAVPEPGTMCFALPGAIGMALVSRLRRMKPR
jgi:hypothetical protein